MTGVQTCALPIFYAGRPSLTKEGVTSPRVTVRLSQKLHEQAKKKAKKKGISVSVLTRLALEKYLKAG